MESKSHQKVGGLAHAAVPPLQLGTAWTAGPQASGSSSAQPRSSQLEVVCEYDANMQAAGFDGWHGTPVRPLPPSERMSAVAWLFRWYSKRGTHFRRPPTPEDLQGAPPLPRTGLSGSRPLSSSARSGECDAPGPNCVPPHPRPVTADGTCAAGRQVSHELDPVMSCQEIVDMLEEWDVVPG